jgi:mannose-6-phosphate isomerase-like protein (cupin superfamily)
MALNNPILDATLNTISLEEIKAQKGAAPWVHTVVLADHLAANLIYQNAGQENDNHCHNYDEWWIVLEGEIDWVIEGRDEPVQAKAGDFVYVPAQTFHHIFPKGDKPSVRLGIALPGQGHLHQRPTNKARVTIDV